jgi:peroxiredoxin Q/BCP
MLDVGERAPEFTLPDQTGRERSLTRLSAEGALLLYFYQADFMPICTGHACALRDLHAEIQRCGITLVGISPQSPESHARFGAQYRLPFPLLADEEKTVIKMYGVNGPLGLGVRRATFLIDASRRVRDRVRADFRIGSHADFITKALQIRSALI